jgi:hypothetical protein
VRFRQGAALVRLEQHRVGRAESRGLAHQRRIGHEEVVADDLDPRSRSAGEAGEALRVVLGERVLDRDDRVLGDPAQQQLDHRVGVELARLEPERVAAVAAELGRGDVEGDRDLCAGNEAGPLDRLHQGLERLLVGLEVGPPAALVGDAAQRPALLHQEAGMAVDLGRPLQRLGEALRAGADHHEILDVDPAPRVRAAAEDLDLRHR